MALTLSEDLIRNRVNLQHDNLEDVKSLALPGTYHEKVVSVGSSLRKFSRLKALDLSRNNISGLQGLENLKLLEKLNLYYNNIGSLDELKRLKFNPNLRELDLRLNPVTRTESDYRLYLIHMLPNLQKLDDRSVRDKERQGALIHFSSSQATEMTHHSWHEEPEPRPPNPRAEHVKEMGKGKITALDDDDVEILDLIARTSGDLRKARPITGSSAKEPAVEDYSLAGLKRLDPGLREHTEKPSREPPAEIDDVMQAYMERYPNISAGMTSGDSQPKQGRKDPNLEYEDESEAYNKFRSHGYFTANPGSGDGEESQYSQTYIPAEKESYPPAPTKVRSERQKGPDPYEDLDNTPDQRRQNTEITESEDSREIFSSQYRAEKYTEADKIESERSERQSHGQRMRDEESRSQDRRVRDEESRSQGPVSRTIKAETPQTKEFLMRIMDLVDRYWNGTKSLHKNVKFKGLSYGVIDDFMKSLTEKRTQLELQLLQDEVMQLKQDNSRLRQQQEITKSFVEDSTATETHLKASLQRAYTDVELLKDKLQNYVQENKRLQRKLQQVETTSLHQSAAASSASTTVNQTQIEELQRQNNALQREVDKLHIKQKQYNQLQELAAMLQESHKSLVQTNDHLLKELDESRQRHSSEVQQLHWSYDQLKKTMSYLPPSADNSTTSVTMYGRNDQ